MTINEDIYDRHIAQLLKFLAPIDWKNLFYSYSDIDSKLQINWEKITRKQITIVNSEDRYDHNAINIAKKYESTNMYVFLKDDKIFAVLFGDKFVIGKDGKAVERGSKAEKEISQEIGIDWTLAIRLNKAGERKKFISDIVYKSDETWVIDLRETIDDTRDLRKLRDIRKQGVWTNTPEFYAKWIKENMAKFEAKLKELKAKRVIVDNTYAQQISDFSKNVMDVYNELMTNGDKYDYNQDIENRVRKLRYNMQNLSEEYDDFIYYIMELGRSKKESDRYGEQLANDSLDKCIKDLTSAIAQANANLVEVKTKMQTYLANKR